MINQAFIFSSIKNEADGSLKKKKRNRSWKDRDDGMSRQELESCYYKYLQSFKGKHEHNEVRNRKMCDSL